MLGRVDIAHLFAIIGSIINLTRLAKRLTYMHGRACRLMDGCMDKDDHKGGFVHDKYFVIYMDDKQTRDHIYCCY